MLLKNPFESKLSKPLVLDGAMGSYLQQKGLSTDDILWTTNINHNNPDLILQTHLGIYRSGSRYYYYKYF